MMEIREKLVISDRAMETIERESRKQPKVETGGILAGKRLSDRVIVTHATGPGPEADLEPLSFHKDTRYLQGVLNLLFGYFGVNYLGTWHKHPPELDHPSGLDISGAIDELKDEEIGLERLLLPICLLKEDNSVELKPYFVDESGSQAYGEKEWEVVPYNSLLSPILNNIQWYKTPAGKERLKEELSLFESNGAVVEVKKAPDGAYSFQAGLPSSRKVLIFSCSNEYPVSPPEAVLLDPAAGSYTPVNTTLLTNWIIDRWLIDIYQEVTRSELK